MKQLLTVIALSAMTANFAGATAPTPRPQAHMPFAVRMQSAPECESARISPFKSGPMRAKAHDVPFIEDFSDPSTLGDWNIQDVNNDGHSWEYKQSAQNVICYFDPDNQGNNDWLVTPAINLGKDDIYTLTFSYGSQGSRYKPEKLAVTMGTNEFATRHTTVLFTDENIQNFWNGSMKTVTVTLPVEEDGAYYFGFHCYSPAGGYALYLDDVKVEQNGSHAAPDAVSNLTVTPGDKGALTATVSLTAPTKTSEGSALSALDHVKLYVDGNAVHTFDAPAPGATLTQTLTELTRGTHTFRAVTSAQGLEGAKSEVSAYIGIDTPLSVTDLRGEEQGTDVKLSWTAPLGANGGYVGADVVKYRLTRIDSDAETIIAAALQSTDYIDRNVASDTQNHVYYTVEAYTESGNAEAVASNSLFVGPAYAIPFTENFDYCNLTTSPWIMEQINAGWWPTQWQTTPMGSLPVCPPIDGDDGMLEFVSKINGLNLYAGNIVRLATPAIDLSTAAAPYVEFYLFHYDTTEITQEYDEETQETVTTTTTYNDKLHLQVALDNGDYVDLEGSEIMLAKNNAGWTKYTIPLDVAKGHKKVSVALVGTADGGGNICVDHFKVTDSYANDLAFTGLLGPALVCVGETASYTANIINFGKTSTKNYEVELYVDNTKVASAKGQGAAIFANGGEKTVKLEFTPTEALAASDHELYALIAFADDDCSANNRSQTIVLTVPAPNSLPTVSGLSAVAGNGTVELSWDEPDMTAVRESVLDRMESHEAFATSNIGGYTLIDNDKASNTYVVGNIQDYPNAGAAMAWQVFDPQAAGIDTELDFNRRWTCHSGNQCLISWGADVSTGVTANDDWLISPELSGESQKISFYIKSVSLAYPERFRVLYSTDTKSVSDFVKVAEANYYTPTSYWRKFSVTLPKGARYFAIHCISADAFGLMVDDITFSPKSASVLELDFLGYNVYRDGVKINHTPLGEASFTDNVSGPGAHTYYVTALFTDGESAPSPSVTPEQSKIDEITSTAPFVAVGHEGCIEVDGCNGLVTAFSLEGKVAAREYVTGNLTFTIAPGVYIVNHNGHNIKTIVK